MIDRKRLMERERRARVRAEAITILGGACKACGIDYRELLDIDHVNNDGWQDRKKGLRTAEYVRKDPTRYQLLCKNCNWLKELSRRQKEKGL